MTETNITATGNCKYWCNQFTEHAHLVQNASQPQIFVCSCALHSWLRDLASDYWILQIYRVCLRKRTGNNKLNDETIIKLGYRKIPWFISDKSRYFSQPRPIIVYCRIENTIIRYRCFRTRIQASQSLNTREFGKYNVNTKTCSSTIAFLLEDKGDFKLYLYFLRHFLNCYVVYIHHFYSLVPRRKKLKIGTLQCFYIDQWLS